MGASNFRVWIQSALEPRGPQAERMDVLWWLFLIVCTAVFVAVCVATVLAVVRPGRRELTEWPKGEPGKIKVVLAATGGTLVILMVFLVASIRAGDAMSRMPTGDERPVTVQVIGHQWWWEVHYLDDDHQRLFTTANELRIPVGRPVILRLTSRDVIHSFWVPNLHGKMDLLPGKVNVTWLQADHAGEYRGQCAEFCGLQHAKMAFMVVAEEEAAYERWVEAQRAPAAAPLDPDAARGLEVFRSAQCSLCHTIRGTGAWGLIAPDLTHLASRRTLAAGTVPNTRGHLGGWILDPQSVKPGAFMPPTLLDGEEFQALLTYLGSLR